MIVIAAYNSLKCVQELLNSMTESVIDEDVLVVSTCPKQIDFIKTVKEHIETTKYPFKVLHTVTPYTGYDSGAYIWAFMNYEDEYYTFLHDSVVANHSNWFEGFKSFRQEDVMNIWCYFNILTAYDPDHAKFFLPKMKEYPNLDNRFPGVFGPMFQISRKALILIDEKYDLKQFIPTHKNEACAMERGWTYLVIGAGLGVNVIDGHYALHPQEYQHKLLTKYFKNRH